MHTSAIRCLRFIPALLLVPLLAFGADTSPSINKTFTHRISYTGAQTPELVEVQIAALNIHAPVTWALTIKAGKQVIFRHTQTDTKIDKFFGDPGFVENCNDYLECKRKYYLSDLPASFVLRSKFDLNDYFIKNLRSTTSQFLLSNGVSESQVSGVTDDMIVRLKADKVMPLVVLESPVHSGPPMMWVPKINRFVPFYQE